MPNTVVQATGAAMPKSHPNIATRRAFLGGFAAVSVLPTTAAMGGGLDIESAVVIGAKENPDLLRAYEALLAARAEQEDAKEALEWLADEWRHVWPLAPEELLRSANADKYGHRDNAERDIAGRFLKRDTSALTTRFSRKSRERPPVTCFSILTAEEASETIEIWTRQSPKGRTEKALERNRANRARIISEYQHKLALALDYEEETARLREASGVEQVKQRIAAANTNLRKVCGDISNIPARTQTGLHIKAEALNIDRVYDDFLTETGLFGEVARFIQSVRDLGSV